MAGSLEIDLADDEWRSLEAPYTSRHDVPGASGEAGLHAIRALIAGMAGMALI